VNEGVILKLDIDGSPARYDSHTHPHYHIKCTNCGKIDDISLKQNIAVDKIIEKKIWL